MMPQTKYKYFNNKIKILLLILMWTLIWQHVYGKSSSTASSPPTYDEGDDVYATTAYDSSGGGIGRETIEENNTKIKQITATLVMAAKTTTLTTATEDEDNNATIYDHYNENDNNSNKLSQNVAKKHQQQQTTMMKFKMPPSPPIEQVLMAKVQLNKEEEDKISQEKDDKNVNGYENKQEESEKVKMSMTKVNDVITSTIKSNSNSNFDTNYDDDYLNLTSESNSDEIATTTFMPYTTIDDSSNDNSDDFFDTEKDNEESQNQQNDKETSDRTSLVQQQLIYQFAIKYKEIPKVTYFTCRQQSSNLKEFEMENSNNIFKRHTNMNMQMVKFLKHMFSSEGEGSKTSSKETKKSRSGSLRTAKDLMIKIFQIDHLTSKRGMNTNNAIPRSGYGRANGFRGGSKAGGAQSNRNTFTNTNWLEQVLRVETLRQIVVLDLSCGESSRRLLEMASNKALFNSMYHWLLIEDYTFNRQTEIDDADDVKNRMNSGGSGSGTNNSKQEVVNNKSQSSIKAKKLSSYTSDVVGASTSGLGKSFASTSSLSATTASRSLSQRLVNLNTAASTNVDGDGVTDEDDLEIIENFLKKLNININTELTLAKRSKRGNMATSSLSTGSSSSIMLPSLTNSAATSESSDDYNTLQKMDYYMLHDVWNPGQQYGGELNVSEIGTFSVRQGFQFQNWFHNSSTIRRRLNMNLAKIRCLVVITHKNLSDTLEEYLTTHYDTHLDSMNRFNFALLSNVRDLFNFSFILSKTSTWGYLKNGKFDGMIGALVRKQADIGGSPIFFRIERAKVIDYTSRTWVARPCFIFRHPRSTKKDRIVFLQPFSNDVWIFLAICGCFTIFFLWILTSLERKYEPGGEDEQESITVTAKKGKNKRVMTATSVSIQRQNNAVPSIVKGRGFKRLLVGWGSVFCGQDVTDNKSKQRVGLFFESFLFYIGSICQQGLAFSTRFFSGRCIVITSLLFSFAIYQFYSASIVGTLLMEKPKTIRTLRDLIHSSLEIGIEDIVYNRDYFLRTKDPDAQELYAKKVTSVPTTGDTGFVDAPPDSFALPTQATELTDAQKAKAYRDILHSHETGAHAKTNEASNWYDPEYGVAKIKKGRFAFHVDVATAYKIIADTFSEKEICDLTEIQLFPPQKMVSIVQKGSPLRKMITYGLRRVTEVGLTDYQRKVWHSPKPRCNKLLHTDDLRVDMQTFTSALLVLIFGYAVSLLILGLEIMHYKLWQRYM